LPKRLFTDKKTHDSAGKPPEHEKDDEVSLFLSKDFKRNNKNIKSIVIINQIAGKFS
jgi:hypothetical protein